MPYTRLFVHLIWSTKDEKKLISDKIRDELTSFILKDASKNGIAIDTINSLADHIHILISLKPDQVLNKIIHLIKKESSDWMNKKVSVPKNFEWENDFMALSVSESNLNKVRKYIQNQQQHHLKKSFNSEINFLLEKSGYKRNTEGYAPAPVFIPQ